ncbi:hypothetical protein ISF_06981 [Cordyceps fumosorosea ARSEF 2679]|uniref:Cyclase n=1 Tax=Cordyceps fumosorosea (strain ARSEF 2679) TaxID=1081104 RepID=A0A167QL77_CORFA|nr:hypothetical protein ISF_06981 [Cordyceps fumosorosea ARSEF 2679]OAA57740.1 hypothetical protein ISF_06981 [Cordyceps fumosorosea ARSEF 2679]
MSHSRPSFDSLPLRADGPPGNAWGLYGASDQLGTLNLLTPARIAAAAAAEIRDGTRVPTDWPLDSMQPPAFGRQPFHHQIVHKWPPRPVNDDVVTFNTQSSTQWDGFRHYGSADGRFYNGTTQEQIMTTDEMGTHAWVETGGIVGRGVLLDWAAWAERQDRKVDVHSSHAITAAVLDEVAASQGIAAFLPGDILFIRTGFTESYDRMAAEARAALTKDYAPDSIGLESSRETLRWLWDRGFAAVAGDQPALEALPFPKHEHVLHEWLLPGWGMPIGELFSLKRLSEACAEKKRWTFFFTSMPIYVKGGVASPPNGIAIF